MVEEVAPVSGAFSFKVSCGREVDDALETVLADRFGFWAPSWEGLSEGLQTSPTWPRGRVDDEADSTAGAIESCESRRSLTMASIVCLRSNARLPEVESESADSRYSLKTSLVSSSSLASERNFFMATLACS